MDDHYGEWGQKGATLSQKTAENEYGLTWGEMVAGIRAGKLQYREGSMHGNPWIRLLRREVEALVKDKRGADYVQDRKVKTEMARIDREVRQHKARIAELEKQKAKLLGR